MINRRYFTKSLSLLATTTMLGQARPALATLGARDRWLMPDESEPHLRTWMAFGANEQIWGSWLLPAVQRNLAGIALTIAEYEPVTMLVRPSDMPLARRLMGTKVELISCPLDDLWMRDTGPVFVVNANGAKAAVDFNFNGWGAKQEHSHDAEVAAFVASHTGVTLLETGLVLEGGGIEVDGHGTAIITESCVLNDNRNPSLSKSQCERELKRLLGLEKIIWLPGIKAKDITDGHTDFYARFVRPGMVVAAYDSDPSSFDHVVTEKHLEILGSATDAAGRKLEVVILETPSTIRERYDSADFAAGYVNFYVCNGAVLVPEFGDSYADSAAERTLQLAFPEHEIVMLNIDAIAAGGGGIHCTTQQEPLV